MYILIIYTCLKNLNKSKQIRDAISKINCKIIILYGNPDLNENFVYDGENQILIVKCKDDYDNLTNKTLCLIKFIQDIEQCFKGLIKCDDDIDIDIDKFNNFLNDLDEYKNIHYLGKITYTKEIYSKHHKELQKKNKDLYYTFNTYYCGGPLYYLSFDCISKIKNKNLDKNYYEDNTVGFNILNNGFDIYNYPIYADFFYLYDNNTKITARHKFKTSKSHNYYITSSNISTLSFVDKCIMISQLYFLANKHNLSINLNNDNDIQKLFNLTFKPINNNLSYIDLNFDNRYQNLVNKNINVTKIKIVFFNLVRQIFIFNLNIQQSIFDILNKPEINYKKNKLFGINLTSLDPKIMQTENFAYIIKMIMKISSFIFLIFSNKEQDVYVRNIFNKYNNVVYLIDYPEYNNNLHIPMYSKLDNCLVTNENDLLGIILNYKIEKYYCVKKIFEKFNILLDKQHNIIQVNMLI